jgi:hypothetical protein
MYIHKYIQPYLEAQAMMKDSMSGKDGVSEASKTTVAVEEATFGAIHLFNMNPNPLKQVKLM